MEYSYQQPAPERCVKAMKKSGKLGIAVGGILLGVLLLFVGNRTGKADSDPSADPPSAAVTEARSVEAYRAELETRMEALCARVTGVGTVEVAVMLEGGYTYVYATDVKETAGGETRTYVTVGSGSQEAPIYITERPPAIVGIGVVCTGGMDPEVRREVTALLSAAFGVGSNKIYVTGGR